MSAQFGRWNLDGKPVDSRYIERVATALGPYGPDGGSSYRDTNISILYGAFHTTKESRLEAQPHISASGAVITWDGRLDNRPELIIEMRDSLTANSTDVAIVAAAYEKWGTTCFAKLIGDWALSVWSPNIRSLLLAKDPIGTRPLYYSFDNDRIIWSTIFDPLVRLAGKTFALDEEYIAGWLSMFPAAHLTPCVSIHAVPPSSFVLLRPGKHSVSKYWDFAPENQIRYHTDAEYEEHFRTVFATAVQRRLRSDKPVLAELSGGMDSSSIVCMADTILTRGHSDCPRLDTISWYRSSSPGLDERPYFTKVEAKRGQVGCHIDLDSLAELDPPQRFQCEFENDHFAATPNSNKHLSDFFKRYAALMKSQDNRVTLSGLGGDEATGSGIPTPTPELQDLLARARFITLARQLNAWATKMGKSRLALLGEAFRGFFIALSTLDKFIDLHPAPWFYTGFVRRNRAALGSYPSRLRLFGPLPSFQDNMRALDAERRLQAHIGFSSDLLNREVRCPYLDRTFLEFMYAIPREQVVRVGQRRSLMRRALAGIVPDELLKIRNKTAVVQDPIRHNSEEWATSVEIGLHMVSNSIGIVDPSRFCEAMRKTCSNEGVSIERLMRTLMIEFWLRHLTSQGVLSKEILADTPDCPSISETAGIQARAQPISSVR
jgi:asparagine synthase (glutamine-hydrolysing)